MIMVRKNKTKQNLQLNLNKLSRLLHMKGQNRKVIQGVMKSPSPDIAHRSIIANTRSPANEIKEYIKMRESSTSPKSMTTSFHHISKSSQSQEINKLKRYIQQLEGKIKFYQKIQISHDQLALINQSLNNQISQLRLQLLEKQRSHSNNSRNVSPSNIRALSPKANGVKGVSLVRNSVLNANPEILNPPQSSQNDTILRQFNERIVKMSQQNKRLGKKLKQIKDQRDYLQKQNSVLKTKNKYEAIPHYVPSQDNELIKRFFVEQTEKMSNYYQRLNEEKISQLKGRISEVQAQLIKVAQKQNRKRPYTRTNTPNELKANMSMDTNFRSQNQDEGPSSLPGNRYNMIESKYTTSPSEFKTFTLETSPIRVLEEEKQKIKRQNQYLVRKTMELQKQLRTALLLNDSLQKKLRQIQSQRRGYVEQKRPLSESSFSLYKTAQQKNESLESQLAKNNAQMRIKDMRITELQKHLEEIKRYYQSKNKDFEKNIEQERHKNNKYQNQIQKYQQQINYYQQNYLTKQKYFYLESQLKQIKDTYNQYTTNFQRYLQMVIQIRYSITGQTVDKCLQDVEDRWQAYDHLELQILKVHECYQTVVKNLKKSLLQKQQKIAQLSKDNQVLLQSNQQTRVQLQKLQKAVNEYRQPIRTGMSEEQLKRRIASHQSGSRSSQKCQIREYINRTVSKISDLENQIQMAIKTHPTQRKSTSTTIHQRKPVEADSIYRPQSRSINVRKGEQSDDCQSDQNPSLIEDQALHVPYQ